MKKTQKNTEIHLITWTKNGTDEHSSLKTHAFFFSHVCASIIWTAFWIIYWKKRDSSKAFCWCTNSTLYKMLSHCSYFMSYSDSTLSLILSFSVFMSSLTCVHIHTHTHAYTHTCIHTRVCVCALPHINIHKYTWTNDYVICRNVRAFPLGSPMLLPVITTATKHFSWSPPRRFFKYLSSFFKTCNWVKMWCKHFV